MEVADAVVDGKDETVMGISHLHWNAEAESGALVVGKVGKVQALRPVRRMPLCVSGALATQ